MREKINIDIMESCFYDRVNNFALCDDDKVAVAVSGGVDSITLVHLVINLMQCNVSIALTVDHGLRQESKKEAEFVSTYVKQLGAVRSFILHWEKENITGNVQSKARKARYRLLTEWCKSNSVKYLFVAHNKNDQAETFLLRLERGSGIDGLSSMDSKSYFNDICILRPLLDFSRSDIEQYAKFYQLKWIEDKSNQDLKHRRTLYRNLLNATDNQETLIQRIYLTTLHMKRAVKTLAYYTRLAFDTSTSIHELGYIEIKLSVFNQLPEEIAMRVFLYSIMVIGNKYYKPRYNSLIVIFNKILQKDCIVNHTLSGCKIKKLPESILIIRESSKIIPVSVDLPLDKPIQWDNRFKCTILGNQQDSVYVAPLRKTDAIPQFLKDHKCCSDVLYALPIVQKGEKVLTYPGISVTTKNSDVQCIISSIIKENLISLINIG